MKNLFFHTLFVTLKTLKKISVILFYLILYRLFKNKTFKDHAISEVLIHNIIQSHKMYNDINFNYKLKSLILMMNKQIKKDKKKYGIDSFSAVFRFKK